MTAAESSIPEMASVLDLASPLYITGSGLPAYCLATRSRDADRDTRGFSDRPTSLVHPVPPLSRMLLLLAND